jgi:hypothetical protein
MTDPLTPEELREARETVEMFGSDEGATIGLDRYARLLATLDAALAAAPDGLREALQAVWDLGDALDSNHARWAALQVADRMGVEIRAHNDFSEPPRNRNEEIIAELKAQLEAALATPEPAQ